MDYYLLVKQLANHGNLSVQAEVVWFQYRMAKRDK
jgi:hypothetical protein